MEFKKLTSNQPLPVPDFSCMQGEFTPTDEQRKLQEVYNRNAQKFREQRSTKQRSIKQRSTKPKPNFAAMLSFDPNYVENLELQRIYKRNAQKLREQRRQKLVRISE